MRAYLDGIDWSTPDAVRSLRAAVGATAQRALASPRAWNAQRAKSPRLPEASVVGIGGGEGEDAESRAPRRRRRRRRLQTATVDAMPNGVEEQVDAEDTDTASGAVTNNGSSAADGQPAPARKRRRRRRRKKPAAGEGGATENGNGAVEDRSVDIAAVPDPSPESSAA
jgi:hypothetical protein